MPGTTLGGQRSGLTGEGPQVFINKTIDEWNSVLDSSTRLLLRYANEMADSDESESGVTNCGQK